MLDFLFKNKAKTAKQHDCFFDWLRIISLAKNKIGIYVAQIVRGGQIQKTSALSCSDVVQI